MDVYDIMGILNGNKIPQLGGTVSEGGAHTSKNKGHGWVDGRYMYICIWICIYILYYIILYCIVLYYIILYYIVLYYIIYIYTSN
jgi:hypothetical protein